MRTNNLSNALKASNRPLFGIFMNFATARQVEFVGHLGFDWVLLDAEHDGLTVEQAYDLVIAADNVGLGSVVRVPANRPELLLAYAETGANSIIAPHVRDAAAGEQLVSSLAFPPRGTRGLGSGSRAANYGVTQTALEYFTQGSHAMPAALLEDVSAYDDIDALLAIDGLDIFCLGAGDLSGSLGIPGQYDHEDVKSRVQMASDKILAAGKIVSSSVGTAEAAYASAKAGHRLIACTNTGLLSRAAKEFLDNARRE